MGSCEQAALGVPHTSWWPGMELNPRILDACREDLSSSKGGRRPN